MCFLYGVFRITRHGIERQSVVGNLQRAFILVHDIVCVTSLLAIITYTIWYSGHILAKSYKIVWQDMLYHAIVAHCVQQGGVASNAV